MVSNIVTENIAALKKAPQTFVVSKRYNLDEISWLKIHPKDHLTSFGVLSY